MLDQYGRNISYMRVSITDCCNLRCMYCMPEEGVKPFHQGEILTCGELLRIIEAGTEIGIRHIKITGGEPLVKKDAVPFISSVKKIEGIETVTMTTNGVCLEENADQLKAAGIDGINISLDTLNNDTYFKITGYDVLEKVIRGIRKVIDIGISNVKINCVLMKGVNDNETEAIIRFAMDMLIPVRFIEMMPVGCGEKYDVIPNSQTKQIIETKFGNIIKMEDPRGNGPAVYYKVDMAKATIGFISALSRPFCKDCNRIRLTADGVLKPCLQYSTGCQLRDEIRKGISNEELTKLMKKAIYYKPKEHRFSLVGEENVDLEIREMIRIGG